MLSNGSGKKSFKTIGYFYAEIEIAYSKFETSAFVFNDYSIDFYMSIDTYIIELVGILNIYSIDVTINKCQNNSKNSLV